METKLSWFHEEIGKSADFSKFLKNQVFKPFLPHFPLISASNFTKFLKIIAYLMSKFVCTMMLVGDFLFCLLFKGRFLSSSALTCALKGNLKRTEYVLEVKTILAPSSEEQSDPPTLNYYKRYSHCYRFKKIWTSFQIEYCISYSILIFYQY